MNTYTLFTFVVALSAASAHVIAPSAAVIQGPSRKTTLVGPEGSVISAVAPGGQIITEEHPGVVAHAAPVHGHIVAAPVHAAPTYSAPAYSAPAYSAPAYAAPAYAAPAYAAPAYAAPAYSAPAYAAPIHAVHAVAPQVIAAFIVDDAPGFPAVAGHYGAPLVHGVGAHGAAEGQYVHDHSEALYDDGSYKPHLH